MALVAGSSALLWWNEGRTARLERMLQAARRDVLPVDATAALDDADDVPAGRLVHLQGALSTDFGVRDGLFGEVARPEALRLRRRTEAYEWAERKHTSERRVSDTHVKRSTSYHYDAGWRTSHQHSGHFHDRRHHNPHPRLPPGQAETLAADASLPNGLNVPDDLLTQLDGWEPLERLPKLLDRDGGVIAPLPERRTEAVYLAASGATPPDERPGGGAALTPTAAPQLPRRVAADPSARVELSQQAASYLEEERGGGGAMPVMGLPPAPRIGDTRVSFEEVTVPHEGVSILATLGRDGRRGGKPSLRPWSRADRDARLSRRSSSSSSSSSAAEASQQPSLFMLVRGAVSPSAMLDLALRRGGRIKWAFRGLGAGLMWAGGASLLSFLPALAAYLPFVGPLASSLVGAASAVASLGGALAASALVIAAAWARFRPLHAFGLAAAAAAALGAQGALLQRAAVRHSSQPLGRAVPATARGRRGGA